MQPEKTLIPLVVHYVTPISILAFAIVLTQLAGLIFAQGAWIDTAYEVLARSSIIAAIAVSLLGYGYCTTTGAEADD